MMDRITRIATLLLMATCTAAAQTPEKTSFIGTISAVLDIGRIEVTPDGATAIVLNIGPDSVIQRVAPGEKDLKNAHIIQLTDIAKGDRVLVNLFPESHNVGRLVVMSSEDIRERNEADRMDWMRQGTSGVVVSKTGNQITLRRRSFAGEQQTTVTVGENTKYRRYAPDSVVFADAKPSSLEEISLGDQLRARGTKSESGFELDAEEVVFGTFLTKAGVIQSVSVETKEITIEDLETGKPLVVAISPDSQLKKMPDSPLAMGANAPSGPPGNGTPPGGVGPGPSGRAAAQGMGPRPGGSDIVQMLERMPAATLDDLKAGQTIVLSSTSGARTDRVTAIMLVANAEFLIRTAAMQSGTAASGGIGPTMSGFGTAGFGGMMGEFPLPGLGP